MQTLADPSAGDVSDSAGARQCFIVADRFSAGRIEAGCDAALHAPLGRLLALLGCGEEAACLAFDRLQSLAPSHVHALASIALDERSHDAMLQGIMAGMQPEPPCQPAMAAMRRIHVRLGRSPLLGQCAGIAALDSALCTLLSALLGTASHIPQASGLHAVLRRIRDDEARHVAITRDIALTSPTFPQLRDLAARTRRDLADALAHVADDFEQLGINPMPLLARVACLPNGLLSA